MSNSFIYNGQIHQDKFILNMLNEKKMDFF